MKIVMKDTEIKLFESHLNLNDIVLEYGCGGSTLHFSKFVKYYYYFFP